MIVGRQRRIVVGDRHVQRDWIAPAELVGWLECLGSHADHLVRHIVDADDRAHQIPRRPQLLPQAMADDRYAIASGGAFVGTKGTAEERLDAQEIEEWCRHHIDPDALRLSATGQILRPQARPGQPGKCVRVPFEVAEAGEGDRVPFALALDLPERDEPVRIAVRQGTQQHGVDGAHDHAGDANAERQGRQRGDGEARRLHEGSEGVANVGPQRLDPFRAAATALRSPIEDQEPGPHAVDVAEFGECLRARGVLRAAAGHQFLHPFVQVETELIVDAHAEMWREHALVRSPLPDPRHACAPSQSASRLARGTHGATA